MPTLLLHEADTVRALPLAPATLVGRAPACLVRVSHEACPAHWLELRWFQQGWAWRPLAAVERTYGTGAFLTEGWRALEAALAKNNNQTKELRRATLRARALSSRSCWRTVSGARFAPPAHSSRRYAY